MAFECIFIYVLCFCTYILNVRRNINSIKYIKRLKILGKKYAKLFFETQIRIMQGFFFNSNNILVLIDDNQVIKNVDYSKAILVRVTLGILPLFMLSNVEQHFSCSLSFFKHVGIKWIA